MDVSVSHAWVCAKQAAGAVEQRPHLGPRDYLTVSIAVPKKSLHGEGGWWSFKREQGPRAGHSLVTLASVLFLSSNRAIRKPKHNDLLWTEISVCGFQKLLLTLSWQELQLRGHLSWSCGLCVLRKLQTQELGGIRQSVRLLPFIRFLCVSWTGAVLFITYLKRSYFLRVPRDLVVTVETAMLPK